MLIMTFIFKFTFKKKPPCGGSNSGPFISHYHFHLAYYSSISSMMNSLSAVTWEDFLKRVFSKTSDQKAVIITKILGKILNLNDWILKNLENCTISIPKAQSYCRLQRSAKGLGFKSHLKEYQQKLTK